MKKDNRNYQYSPNSKSHRLEYPLIFDLIKNRSSVIDLGCGDGSLLSLLSDKGIKGIGLDVSKSAVAAAGKKGLSAIEGRIDSKLPYTDKRFDYAVCNVTLQMVAYPEILLSEMRRIAKKQIVSFPNFAFIFNRFDLLVNGRMPRVMIPGFDWYSTGHIHQLSVRDFANFAKMLKFRILNRFFLYPKNKHFSKKLRLFPNLLAVEALYLMEAYE